MNKLKLVAAGLITLSFFAVAGIAYAVNTTVPTAPSSGYGLQAGPNGTPGNYGYIPTTTEPWHVGSIFASSTTSWSYFVNTVVSGTGTTSVARIGDLNHVIYAPSVYTPSTCAASTTANTYQNCVQALIKNEADHGATGITFITSHDVQPTEWTGPLQLNQPSFAINFKCEGSAKLIYGGADFTRAIQINNWDSFGHVRQEFSGCQVLEQATLIHAGDTNTRQTVGLYCGGNVGCVGWDIHDNTFNGFGTQIEIGANSYLNNVIANALSGGNGTTTARGSLVHINTASNSGERNVYSGNSFTDPGNSQAVNAVYISSGGTASNFFSHNSFDDAQFFCGASNGMCALDGNHIENSAFAVYGRYIPIQGVSSDRSTMLTVTNNSIANDTSGANSFDTIIQHGGQLYAAGNIINNYGGGTISTFVDHSLDNGVATDLVCQTQVQGGALTNLIGGSGGVAYTRATGNTCVYNVDNSYTIGLRAMASNTNEFFSGSVTTGTFDHSGNWTLGVSAVPSMITIQKNLTVTGSTTLSTFGSCNTTRALTTDSSGNVTCGAVSGSGGGTFPFTPGVFAGLTANSTSTPIRFLGTGSYSTIASSTFASLASTTNFENTLYADSWPGADIGKKIQNAYDASIFSPHIHVSGNGTSTFPTTIDFGTEGKRVVLTCDPGVTLQYTGTVAAINLNATNLAQLRKGWGVDGCHIVGNGSYQGVGIVMGGTHGAQGAYVKNSTFEGFTQAITVGANTWLYDIDYNLFIDNTQALYVGPANNSGEGASFDHDTFADCRSNLERCVFFDTNASDGAYFGHPIFDDAGVYFSDGVLGWTIDTGKWENPGAPTYPSYTYLTCESGGFNNGTLLGGTMMNGAPNLLSAPRQFGLIGCKLTIAGSLTFDNNSTDDSTIPSAFNVFGLGTLNVQAYDDISVSAPTVAIFSTTTPQWLVDDESGVIDTTLPLKIFFGSNLSTSKYLFLGEDAGNGFTDLGAYDPSAGFFGLYIDANPLVINNRGGGNTGFGTSSPFARVSIATPAGSNGSVTTLFAIASSTGLSTSTLFSVSNTGTTTLGRFGACNTTSALTTNSSGQISCGAISSGVTSLIAGSGISVSGATGAVTVTNTIGYPFPGNATSTSLNFTNKLGLGTTTPYAQFSILATSTTGIGSPTTLMTIASTTGGTSTSTLFSMLNTGQVDFLMPKNPTAAKNVNIHTTADNAILAVGRDDGSLLQFKAQDTGQSRITYSKTDGNTGSALLFDSDQGGTLTLALTSDNKVGVGATSSPIATLGVQGTVAAKLTTFTVGDSAVCQRGAGGLFTLNAGQTTCAVSSQFVKDYEGDVAYKSAKERLDKVHIVQFKYKESGQEAIGAFAEEMAAIDPRYAQYETVEETIAGHTFHPGEAKGVNWAAVQSDMIVIMQHESPGMIEKAVRGAEENWQDGLIAGLIVAVLYLFNETKKLKQKK